MALSPRRLGTQPAYVFDLAAGIDGTVAATPAQLRRLASRRVTPTRYSRAVLLESMAAGRIALFSGLRLPVAGARGDAAEVLSAAVPRAFPERETVSAMRGADAARRRLTVRELVDRWRRDDEIVSITDLHIRQTPLERVIDTRAISDYNILWRGSEDMAWHEMMTMVLSSKGAFTDSHSDDPDGSNHCFAGRKLWLAWDTFDGRRAGLQDVERDTVPERARFSIERFLGVPSARWFVVSPGLTLFLPGDLTHKVITLERYVGVGSFYLSAPNAVRTIARWLLHGPLWLDGGVRGNTWELVDEMAETARVTIQRWRRDAAHQQRRLGLHLLRPSARRWASGVSTAARARLLRNAAFKGLLTEALR